MIFNLWFLKYEVLQIYKLKLKLKMSIYKNLAYGGFKAIKFFNISFNLLKYGLKLKFIIIKSFKYFCNLYFLLETCT